jgi:predicted urease superfamily metal-dependent hydrolase
MDLATVPRRALQWAARGPEMVERLRVPFQEAIQSVYGFTPETRPMGAP